MLTRVTKVARALFLVVTFFLTASLIGFFFGDEHERKLILTKTLKRFAKWLLNALNVTVTELGHEESASQHLILANHVSYLDAVVLAANRPCLFVTSVEMSKQWFLGLLAKASGSLHVERRRRGPSKEQVDPISQAMRDGFNVVVFDSLRNVVDSSFDVLPVTLHYREPMSYDVKAILSASNINVEVQWRDITKAQSRVNP